MPLDKVTGSKVFAHAGLRGEAAFPGRFVVRVATTAVQ
jgi:hypothetical protein